jgi:hypothetical protein
MHNSLFNLTNQLIQEQKSVWRIENAYAEDSANADEKKFWKSLLLKKKKTVEELNVLIKKHK